MIRRTIGAPLLIAVLVATLFGGFAGAQTTYAAPTTSTSSGELSARGSFSWDSWWSYWRFGADRPHIRSISPTSGDEGTTVTLTGRRFNEDSVVRFGKGAITDPTVSDDGRTITFVVPDEIGKYCPPNRNCTLEMYDVVEGKYNVRVQNGHRTSNTKHFEVTDDDSSDGSLQIESVNGPTALRTGSEGSWTINLESDGEGNLEYRVKWGDEPSTLLRASLTSEQVQSSSTFTHTYDTPGTYQPEFTVTDGNGNTVTKKGAEVVVSNGSDSNSGVPHITSISTSTALVGTNVSLVGTGFDASSTVMIGSTTASDIDVNSSTSLSFTIPSLALGTYSVRVMDDNGTSNAVDLTVASSAPAKTKVSISGLSAPTTLEAGEEGSWTVHVATNAGGNLTYSADWGESTLLMRGLKALGLMTQSSSTFTHTYGTPGTYYPKFTVTDQNGVKASVSATVRIVAAE